MHEYRPYIESVEGPEFDAGLARGRALSIDEAMRYAATNQQG